MPDLPRLLLVGTHNSRDSMIMSVGEALKERLTERGWEVRLTSAYRGRLARVLDILATIWTARGDYDVAVVDVYSGRAFLWAEAAAALLRRLGKTIVFVLRGGSLPEFSERNDGRVRRLLSSAHVVVAPSHYLRQALEPYRSDILLIPNPIDAQRFVFRHRSVAHPRLVWLRAFHRLYNPRLAVETLARVRKSHPNVRLTMIGPDTGDGSHADCRRAAKELQVDDRITWTGGVPHDAVANRLQEGDVFLNTPNIDNVPVSVLEALASGLCVVSTGAGGLPYLLSHEVDALLVPAGDAEAMASSVGRILSDAEVASALSRNARKKAERFDWSAVRGQWEELLSGLKTGSDGGGLRR